MLAVPGSWEPRRRAFQVFQEPPIFVFRLERCFPGPVNPFGHRFLINSNVRTLKDTYHEGRAGACKRGHARPDINLCVLSHHTPSFETSIIRPLGLLHLLCFRFIRLNVDMLSHGGRAYVPGVRSSGRPGRTLRDNHRRYRSYDKIHRSRPDVLLHTSFFG